ncbi:MAG: triphosphoribosyl-dephospho-CoA synthase [Chitinophagales bacterium]|nr:triphosphoribosyl-dephospho-CoA synthase [Hyphomicrobiales bacterium]
MSAESESIAAAFLAACHTELQSLKPGNVHVYADGHRMTVADFEVSAAAAGPFIAAPDLSLGERIEGAMRATCAAVGQNTNLGIILLCAPLAMAAERTQAHHGTAVDRLRQPLADVILRSTVADAECAFRAIALANPGGLGMAEHDVRQPASITLNEAMRLAADRDLIARQYRNGLGEVFGIGHAALQAGLMRFGDIRWAASIAYLTLLSRFTDTHIWRKHGLEAALAVRDESAPFAAMLEAAGDPQSCVDALMMFDASLKARSLNPGAIADLTVATLFAAELATKLETGA